MISSFRPFIPSSTICPGYIVKCRIFRLDAKHTTDSDVDSDASDNGTSEPPLKIQRVTEPPHKKPKTTYQKVWED